MPFFIIFVIIPLTEISLFIAVGQRIGVLPTLLLCVLSAIIGSILLRQQGMATLLSARRAMGRGDMPLKEILDGIFLSLAGVLLMTPGFLTDAMGFALLIPAVRVLILHWAERYFEAQIRAQEDITGIIEADFERVDEDDEP